MKHLFICAITAVLIFSFINFFITSDGNTESGFLPSSFTVAMMSAPPQTLTTPKAITAKAGVIFGSLDSRTAVSCKNALAEALGSEFELRVSEVVWNGGIQRETFDKMVEKGYRLIFLELFDGSPTGYFIDTAKEKGITLILMGDSPTQAQMAHARDSIYYIGYGQKSELQALGETLAFLWDTDSKALDLNNDDKLTYSIISKEDWKENGYLEQMEEHLDTAEIPGKVVQSFVVKDMNTKIEKGIDQMIVKGSDLILCDESALANRVSTYLNDPSEFRKKPNLQIAVLSADADARALVEAGDVAMAIGYDGAELGKKAAEIAQTVLKGEIPNAEGLGLEIRHECCFYLQPTILQTIQ